jgi:hypothetical protein
VLSAEILHDPLLRLTTQGEFAAAGLGNLDLAGDETGPRQEGDPLFIAQSQGSGKTFKHRAVGFGPGNYLDGDSRGVSLQILPEPLPNAAAYDGQVRLAVLDTANDEYTQGAGTMTFLARWDTSLDGDYSKTGGALANVADLKQPPASAPLWGSGEPGMLYTDGLYIEKDRQPGYASLGNMDGRHGALSFWVKPGYDPYVGKFRNHLYVNNTRITVVPGVEDDTQVFLVGNVFFDISAGVFGMELPYGFGACWENAWGPDMDPGALLFEAASQTPKRSVLPHCWYLITYAWDMVQVDPQLNSHMLVDAGQAPPDVNDPTFTRYATPFTGISIDFTSPDASGPSIFYLGRRGNFLTYAGDSYEHDWWCPPDATLDEFAIYDFGPGPGAMTQAAVLAQTRFPDGRFYKESTYGKLPDPTNTAGGYFSAPIDLGTVRIRSLAWTQIVPPGLKVPADPGPDGRILLELTDEAGTGYLMDAAGTAIDTGFTQAQGQAVGRPISAPFRLHAVFQPNLDNPLETPILDPLALDDITVVYQPVTGARVMGWREGE